LKLQNGILKNFGLPGNPDNEKILWFKTIPTDAEVKERLKLLHKTAIEYLLSDAKPDLQTLRDARKHNQDPFIVLAELKICSHSFTHFVYDKILLKKRINLKMFCMN
jgi:hypothetical protein